MSQTTRPPETLKLACWARVDAYVPVGRRRVLLASPGSLTGRVSKSYSESAYVTLSLGGYPPLCCALVLRNLACVDLTIPANLAAHHRLVGVLGSSVPSPPSKATLGHSDRVAPYYYSRPRPKRRGRNQRHQEPPNEEGQRRHRQPAGGHAAAVGARSAAAGWLPAPEVPADVGPACRPKPELAPLEVPQLRSDGGGQWKIPRGAVHVAEADSKGPGGGGRFQGSDPCSG
eukprot:9260992-Pyramimonas_sp.AAC.1